MEAIILAGGFGTRLAHVVPNVPKPMAPIQGKPFLAYLLDWCAKQGIEHVVLAVGYKWTTIEAYFGQEYNGIRLTYSVENTPLLTGGALKKALKICKEANIVVLNGDTFFNVSLKQMMRFHQEKKAEITMAVKPMQNFDRYGTVKIVDGQIIEFEEKRGREQGTINGGIYVVQREQLDHIKEERFSFEEDILVRIAEKRKLYAFSCDGYFVDIGVETDYIRAKIEVPKC